jgi:hypothetical protein
VFGSPNTEPFAARQWDMAIMDPGTASCARATGAGVKVGVIDSGVDFDHPDVAPNLNSALSCSFIFTGTPTADPQEIGNGNCANKAAAEDLNGHGAHVASEIAAPINGIGIAGVAPQATIVALKACTIAGFCFADSVAAALRYAGGQCLDVVNLSLFADPFLCYCNSDAEQKAILHKIEAAARYAQQRGVVIVASAGNEQADLRHPGIDDTSADWPRTPPWSGTWATTAESLPPGCRRRSPSRPPDRSATRTTTCGSPTTRRSESTLPPPGATTPAPADSHPVTRFGPRSAGRWVHGDALHHGRDDLSLVRSGGRVGHAVRTAPRRLRGGATGEGLVTRPASRHRRGPRRRRRAGSASTARTCSHVARSRIGSHDAGPAVLLRWTRRPATAAMRSAARAAD